MKLYETIFSILNIFFSKTDFNWYTTYISGSFPKSRTIFSHFLNLIFCCWLGILTFQRVLPFLTHWFKFNVDPWKQLHFRWIRAWWTFLHKVFSTFDDGIKFNVEIQLSSTTRWKIRVRSPKVTGKFETTQCTSRPHRQNSRTDDFLLIGPHTVLLLQHANRTLFGFCRSFSGFIIRSGTVGTWYVRFAKIRSHVSQN